MENESIMQKLLEAGGVPNSYLQEAISVTKERMEKKGCSIEEAVKFTLKWVKLTAPGDKSEK
jgi:hypothetical protein